MKRPVNPYNIQIVNCPKGADDTAFTAFEKGVDATIRQIMDSLKELAELLKSCK